MNRLIVPFMSLLAIVAFVVVFHTLSSHGSAQAASVASAIIVFAGVASVGTVLKLILR